MSTITKEVLPGVKLTKGIELPIPQSRVKDIKWTLANRIALARMKKEQAEKHLCAQCGTPECTWTRDWPVR